MENNNENIRIMRTVEYKRNGVEETFNIGTSEQYLSADFTREQLRQLRDYIDIVLAEDEQPEDEQRKPCPRGLKGIERAVYLINQKNKLREQQKKLSAEQAEQESRF